MRSRQYVDSGLTFVEVKLKGSRDRTVKERLAYDTDRHGRLDHVAMWFADRCLRRTYTAPLATPLRPASAWSSDARRWRDEGRRSGSPSIGR